MTLIERIRQSLQDLIGWLDEAPETERAISIAEIRDQIYSAIWQMEEDGTLPGYPWPNDIYLDDGQPVVIISAGGKLYRAPIMVDGTNVTLGTVQEIEVQFAPVNSGTVRVIRQSDGRYRWFAIAETAVLNRVSEIDSRDLFDSFIANAETEGYPTLRFFHDPKLDFGRADWLAREDNVLLASGLLDDDSPLAEAFADAVENKRGIWGTSVGFTATQEPGMYEIARGVTIPVYEAGILREISVLPENRAASWFTAIDLPEVSRMRKEVEEELRKMFGNDEKADQFIASVDETNRAIADGGLITREGAETEEEEPKGEGTEETTEETEEQEREVVLTEEALDAITERVQAGFDARFNELVARIEGLPKPVDLAPVIEALANVGGRLDKLERSDEDKRREWLEDQPARKRTTVTYRPRETGKPEDAPTETSSDDVAQATLAKIKEQMGRK